MPWYCINCDRYELNVNWSCKKCRRTQVEKQDCQPTTIQYNPNTIVSPIQHMMVSQSHQHQVGQNSTSNSSLHSNQNHNNNSQNPYVIYNDYYPTPSSNQYQNDLMMFDDNALLYNDHSSDTNPFEFDEDSNLENYDDTHQQLSNDGVTLEILNKYSYLLNLNNSNMPKKNDEDDKTDTTVLGKCIICDVNPRYMAYIHSDNTSHLLSCYDCAKKLKHNNNGCPLCRQSIKSIVKVYL
jgi:hypothetical protein